MTHDCLHTSHDIYHTHIMKLAKSFDDSDFDDSFCGAHQAFQRLFVFFADLWGFLAALSHQGFQSLHAHANA
jgi:hypothetical protein